LTPVSTGSAWSRPFTTSGSDRCGGSCASVTYDIDPSEYTGYRRTTRELKIGQAPREIVQVVREVFLPDGLPGLLRWLEDMRKLPETATENRALHLQYHVDDGRLTTQEGVARAGSMRSP
jgi:hypothetical protein